MGDFSGLNVVLGVIDSKNIVTKIRNIKKPENKCLQVFFSLAPSARIELTTSP